MCEIKTQQNLLQGIKKSYNRKTYKKSVLNKLKVMKNSTFMYTPWASN
jgi:hypothetical protein